MKHLHTFEEFLNESYNGPVAVTFKKVNFDPARYKTLYFTIDGKLTALDFLALRFPKTMSKAALKAFDDVQKELVSMGFDTTLDISKQVVVLNGFYEVFDANNGNFQLVQTHKNHSISFNITEGTLKKGMIEYSNDRPN
jgi:hypothetical protein